MAENSDMMEKMLKMIEVTQQQMQLQATRHQESIDKLIKSMSSGKINGNPGTVSQSESNVSQSQLINVISGRISQFQFDLETEKTFSRWYERHGTTFDQDGKDLPDEAKVSLLVSKLSDEVYEQFSKRICPKKHAEMKFEETVGLLRKMFDVKKSIFSHRFACMNVHERDGDSTVEYTNKVNAMCEAANLDKIDIDGWKVLFWLKGLDGSKDKAIRAYFIKYVEQKWGKEETVTINDLCEEWQTADRQNCVISEMEKSKLAVRAVHSRGNGKGKQNRSFRGKRGSLLELCFGKKKFTRSRLTSRGF
ncbi:unnamed protein product [Caenorhabditis sp. 36 PRJEB53466]|nr:unnamed protein product [Caenorhabditis sp. 36 PRJEB53466]